MTHRLLNFMKQPASKTTLLVTVFACVWFGFMLTFWLLHLRHNQEMAGFEAAHAEYLETRKIQEETAKIISRWRSE